MLSYPETNKKLPSFFSHVIFASNTRLLMLFIISSANNHNIFAFFAVYSSDDSQYLFLSFLIIFYSILSPSDLASNVRKHKTRLLLEIINFPLCVYFPVLFIVIRMEYVSSNFASSLAWYCTINHLSVDSFLPPHFHFFSLVPLVTLCTLMILPVLTPHYSSKINNPQCD